MKTVDSVGITFANLFLGLGTHNGIVNATLGAFAFSPSEKKIDPDPVIVARLRMDMACALAMRDALCTMLGNPEKTEPIALLDDSVVADAKPN